MKFCNMRRQDTFGEETSWSFKSDGVGANSAAKSSQGTTLDEHGATLDASGATLE